MTSLKAFAQRLGLELEEEGTHFILRADPMRHLLFRKDQRDQLEEFLRNADALGLRRS